MCMYCRHSQAVKCIGGNIPPNTTCSYHCDSFLVLIAKCFYENVYLQKSSTLHKRAMFWPVVHITVPELLTIGGWVLPDICTKYSKCVQKLLSRLPQPCFLFSLLLLYFFFAPEYIASQRCVDNGLSSVINLLVIFSTSRKKMFTLSRNLFTGNVLQHWRVLTHVILKNHYWHFLVCRPFLFIMGVHSSTDFFAKHKSLS